MSDVQNRKPKKKENPVREWISDNLRYILLILGIVIVAAVIVLAFKALSSSDNDDSETVQSTSAVVTESSNQVDGSLEEVKADSAADESVVSTSDAAEDTTEDTTAEDEEDSDFSDLTIAATDINTLVNDYLDEQLTSSFNANIESINNVQVYTYPGASDGTYVVFASYYFKYKDIEGYVPTLEEYYAAPDASGNLTLLDSIPADAAEYISGVEQSEEVQRLLQQIQSLYDSTLEENNALADYIQSLG